MSANSNKPVRATVMFGVNDERGMPTGRVEAIQIDAGEDEWDFEGDETFLLMEPGLVESGVIRLGGRFHLPYTDYTCYVGNICWDEVRCTVDDARRLKDYLLSSSSRWTCTAESGPHLDQVEAHA